MIEEPRTPWLSRRTVTKAAAWSVPVIVLAPAAPAFAASAPVIFTIEPFGPIHNNPDGTGWKIFVRNGGTQAIPADSITVVIPNGSEYFLSYYSGENWFEYNFDGISRKFRYTAVLPADDGQGGDPYSRQLLIFFYKVPRDRTDTPVAVATVSVTGAEPQQLQLSVPY